MSWCSTYSFISAVNRYAWRLLIFVSRILSSCWITARCNRHYTYRKLIKEWREHFLETDSVLDRKYTRKPQMPVRNVLWIQEAFVRFSRKSVIRASCELRTRTPCSTTRNVQSVHVMRETACDKDRNVLIEMLDKTDNENVWIKSCLTL